jgi:hypothetical protein
VADRMKRCLLVVAAVMCLQSCAARPQGGESIIEEIHRRYTGKRFTHVTFVQSTRSADGGVELWYEAIRPEGLVRVDIAPLDQRRGFMYRADSMYVFEAGQLVRAKGDERWITMLLLVDIYALPVERSLARLRELGVDVARSHSTDWNGRPAIVVGATSGDTDLFDPAAFGVRRWAEDTYPNVTRGPDCPDWRS